MYGQTTIPIRDELPDYPDSFRGKRLLGVDAYLFGHYWCGDRIVVFERREELRAAGEDATVDVQYQKRAEIPIDQIECGETSAASRSSVDCRSTGGLPEYLGNVGAYLDRYLDEGEPVYADDADEWEWVSAYARDWIASRGPTAPDARKRRYADAATDRQSNRGY